MADTTNTDTTAASGAADAERAAFEAWYCGQMREAGFTFSPGEGICHLREGNHYGEHRVMLNGKWEGWQARAALAAPAAQEAEPAGIRLLSNHEIHEAYQEACRRTDATLGITPESSATGRDVRPEHLLHIGRVFEEAAFRKLRPWLDAAAQRPQVDAGAVPAAPTAAAADALEVVLDAFERKERGRLAATLAASLVEEVRAAIAAQAPAAGAAPTDAEIDDLCREISDYDDPKYFRHMVRAVLARWGAAAPAQEAEDGWMPIETAPDGERVLLGPRHAPVVGTVNHPMPWDERQEITVSVVHYNGNRLVAGYRCSEWRPLPGAARARQEGQA